MNDWIPTIGAVAPVARLLDLFPGTEPMDWTAVADRIADAGWQDIDTDTVFDTGTGLNPRPVVFDPTGEGDFIDVSDVITRARIRRRAARHRRTHGPKTRLQGGTK